jgi:hypothetical protein
MGILNKATVAPATPPSDWGVERRNLTVRDFAFSIKLAGIALLGLPLMIVPTLADFPVFESRLSGLGSLILSMAGVVAIVAALIARGNPISEAVKESVCRSKKWQTDVLVPFLEEKYGIKFCPDTNFFSLEYAYARYQGRTVPVKLRGIKSYYNYKYGEDNFFRSFKVFPDQIALEEIIHPDHISFRTIPPLY